MRSTNDGIETLAGRFVEFWSNDVLPFNAERIAGDIIVHSDGIQHPDFKGAMLRNKAKYHHNWYLRYTPYHLNKRKLSLQKREAKDNAANSVSTRPRVSRSSSSRQSTPTKDTCVICGVIYDIVNLYAAGAFHAHQKKVKREHNDKLTTQWKADAIFLQDDVLLARLSIGTLNSNSYFYHKSCETKLFNRVRKKKNDEKVTVDIKEVKECAWDKVIAFINETPPKEAVKGFDVHDLEEIYLEYVSEYVSLSSHITRFTDELTKRAPAYEI